MNATQEVGDAGKEETVSGQQERTGDIALNQSAEKSAEKSSKSQSVLRQEIVIEHL